MITLIINNIRIQQDNIVNNLHMSFHLKNHILINQLIIIINQLIIIRINKYMIIN